MSYGTRTLLAVFALALIIAAGIASVVLLGESGSIATELEPLDREGSEPSGGLQRSPRAVDVADHDRDASDPERAAVRDPAAGAKLRVYGRVLDRAGRPLRRATVYVREFEEPQFRVEGYDSFSGEYATNVGGEFQLSVDRQGDFRVWALGGAYSEESGKSITGSTSIVSISLSPREPEAELELVMLPDRAIEGRVLDADLKPVSGAEVIAYVDVELAGIELPSATTSVEVYGSAKTRSGIDGAFRLFPIRGLGGEFVVQAETQVTVMSRDAQDVTGKMVRELQSARVTGILPGTRGVSLVLAPQASYSLLLELESANGVLPKRVRSKLQRVGPNGGVYSVTRSWQKPDERGRLRLPGVDSGARYEVLLGWSGSAEELVVGPVVVDTSEIAIPVAIPALHRASVTVTGSKIEANRRCSVTAMHIDEGGVRKRAANVVANFGESTVELQLVSGSYELVVMKIDAERGGDTELGRLIIEVAEANAEFTLEAP